MSKETDAAYDVMLQIAKQYHGEKGRWAYEAFGYINATYFNDQLPIPLIQWAITPHGGCLGHTQAAKSVVTLHPSLLGGTEKKAPWGIDPALLGYCYAFDVLLHECMHIGVEHVLGGYDGPTSHNNEQWVGEVNRIAPLLGLRGIEAGASKSGRVVVDGEFTKTGKPATRVQRVSTGNVPFDVVSKFPQKTREFVNDLSFYRNDVLPFAWPS